MATPPTDSSATPLSTAINDSGAPATNARVRVLLVEDEPVDCLAFTRAVQKENLPYEVSVATCVAEAKAALASKKFEVVLIDKILPDGDGFDLFEAVDDSSAVLFMTRAEDVDLAVRAIKRGAADYLIKDQKREYLKLLPAAVARAVAHQGARREARRYARLLDEAFDHAPIGKAILSATGRFLRVNRAWCELAGRSAAELLAGDLSLVMRPEDLPEILAELLRLATDGTQSVRRERRWRHKSGVERWAQIDASRIAAEPGEAAGVIWQVQDITAQKQAVERLQSSEERFRHLLKSVTDYTYTIEMPEGKPVETIHSPGSTLVTGYSPAEYAAQPYLWFEMVEPADREAVKRHATSALRSETVTTIEHRIRHKNGTLRWVRNTLVPRHDATGRLVACDGLIEDITDRKLVEDALRESEEKFAKVFRNAPMLMAISDLNDATLVDFNEEALRISGFEREEAAGKKTTEIGWITPEDRARLTDAVRAEGRVQGIESVFRAKGGRAVVGLVSSELITIGGRSCLLTTMADITARKQLEDALRQSEERFRTLTAAAFEGIAITEKGALIDANDQLLSMLGYVRDEVIGKTVDAFVAPESRAIVGEHMRAGDEHAYEHRLLRKNGTTIEVEARGRVLVLGDRRLRLTALRDITERKQAEEDRLALERRVQESQKLESLGTLAGGVAHDFNNILAAIFGNVALARSEVPPGHAAQVALTEISQLSERARDLVRQILAFSRPQSDQRAHVDLESLVREAAKMVRATVPSTVQLDIAATANTPAVMADATQIHQVVVNLCTNAWQAIGEKPGHIKLRLASAEIRNAQVAADPRMREGVFAMLAVSDSGCGMDAETLKHIFDPFFSTKGPGQGTGLGLAVVHGIVKAHRGFVTVDSEPGQGSEFRVYLPASMRETPPKPAHDLCDAQPVSPASPAANAAHILFVDDEVPIAKICSLLLRREGFHVTEFTSPDKALTTFLCDPTAFDLVITDMSMPVMNGVDLSLAMLRARPGIPIILATGFTASLTEEGAQKLGIAMLVTKPVGPTELLDRVRRALAKASGGG